MKFFLEMLFSDVTGYLSAGKVSVLSLDFRDEVNGQSHAEVLLHGLKC
ncbi:MAG: hypothetical protein AMDU2_EPLC00008G0062 [Thermoplasmatales archaeon E-plasma]|jgi:hypothetical protein|nr:MAG: hypothetical protein AMDU2_EPLC00008G0062 [Thermoplasmatales archaeon E-plasma]